MIIYIIGLIIALILDVFIDYKCHIRWKLSIYPFTSWLYVIVFLIAVFVFDEFKK